MLEEELKLEVLRSFRKETEESRKEMSGISRVHAIQSEKMENQSERMIKMQSEINDNNKDMLVLSAKHEELARRQVEHNARLDAKIDNHYQILCNDIKNLKDGLSGFKAAVLKQLDRNSGRDAVLKVLITGSLATLLIKTFLGA